MPNSKAEMMELIRSGMQRIRGRNLYRGREDYFLGAGLVVLPFEYRGSVIREGEVRIHFNHREPETWAEVLPGGETFRLEDLDMDLDAFLVKATAICRGAEYLHTEKGKAPYRDKFRNPDPEA